MSQHWHGHWTEETFTAKRLRNWEVSKWYPSWPDRHCGATKFITNDNGHILDSTRKAKCSSWGTYKSTWDLPKRITRSIAEELSATPQYKKEIWELHKKKHEDLCKEMKQPKKKTEIRKEIKSKTDKTVKTDQTDKIQELRQHSDIDQYSVQHSDIDQHSDVDQHSVQHSDIDQHSNQHSDLEQDPDFCINVKKNEED
ncbi:protein Flattop [Odontomachus brunneus]|uniref:protein Flattop n=1 Tax=Odontomachus brunneus TaxID=486640 RepID=UPI0013F1F86C|nr:protein Flattop [Odontomachus brunneus]XP_032668484.1 protein Flattop [Odontomachus brunneus]